MHQVLRRLHKLSAMSLPELCERGRQWGRKTGERWLGFDRGELDDRALRRCLVPPLAAASMETVTRACWPVHEDGRGAWPLRPSADTRSLCECARRRFPEDCDALIERADRAITGRFDLLGVHNVTFGTPIDWHLDPTTGKRTELRHWSTIDYLNPAVAGDKKVTWELNRHNHFVTFGQAFLLTEDERYAGAFVDHVTAWLDANPPRQGINWASSLEVSFRSISWLWALACFGRSRTVTTALTWRLLKSLLQHGCYIESYLSHYFSPNTHLTGEALGLLYLGTALPVLAPAARWREQALHILLAQLPKQVQDDGVYFEQASYYHRYTTDIYLHLYLLARKTEVLLPPIVRRSLHGLLDHLLWITRPDGSSTIYGDEDGGRLLTVHRREAGDFRDTLQIGTALFGVGAWKWAAGPAGPELLWLLGPEGLAAYDSIVPQEPENTARHFHSSGLIVLRDGWARQSSYVFVDGGAHGAANYVHAHADASSFEYAAGGVAWIVDPGTYTYTGDPEWRDRFRSSLAHNTLSIQEWPQSHPAGPFSWKRVAHASVRRFDVLSEGAMCRVEENGYEHLNPPVRHQRSFYLLRRPDAPTTSYLLIHDRVDTVGRYRYRLRFHLAPGCLVQYRHDASPLVHSHGDALECAFWAIDENGQCALMACSSEAGWVSPCYGRRDASTVLVVDAESEGSLVLVSVWAPRAAASALDLERLAFHRSQQFDRCAA